MVLCKFYLNGNCRFGTKCQNEHFDVKQFIKAEVESAIKLNQWPISCFGPFKEKPNIPNFIEDMSYEEVRFMCYEAKKQNCFPAFQQQFSQMVVDAQNKMKALLALTKEVVDIVIQLYDAPGPDNGNQVQQAKQSSNPFATGGNASGQSNMFGNNTASPFGSGGSGGFGGASASTGSIFGGGGTQGFGGNAAQNSIFGSQQQQSQQQTTMFGPNPLSQTTPASGNIFGMAAAQTQQSPSIFGATQPQPNTTSAFGGGAGNTNAFGGGGNIFAQASQQLQQQPQPASGGIFAQAAQQSSPFGGFNQGFAAQSQQQTGNIFSQQQQQQPSAFMQQSSQQAQSAFSSAQPQTQSSVFGAVQAQPPPFGAVAQQPSQIAQQQQAAPLVDQHVYSKMESLTPAEMEAFNASRFVVGSIPTNPPPRELC